MVNEEHMPRVLSGLVVPPSGALKATGNPFEPYRLVDGAGETIGPAAAFFADLVACGRPATTLRSYGMDLLRWFRFLSALEMAQELGIKDSGGSPMRYTFHDFRRIFITDAIMHGMPPHIAQLVAGHRDINTTMGYKAVYPEEVINGHREFIARRRALRPSQEYRTPTDEEWAGFIGHFEHRKVSVGDCGRSYDTPCIHEHSCLRCPLLRPDPTARPRLAQIRDNLIERIAEAESHRWLGEAEGLKVSLAGARAKLAEMDQITESRNTTQLGMPTFTQAAGRTNITPPDPGNGQ